MDNQLMVCIFSLAGTFIGSIGGILASNKLTAFRLEKLETQVSKHNQIVERTYKLEGQVAEIEHDIKDLKAYHKPNA